MIRRDIRLVSSIMNHPAIHDAICDDGCVNKPIDCGVIVHDPNAYPLYPAEGVLILVRRMNVVMGEVHVNALPEYRGKHTLKACKEAWNYIFEILGFRKLVTNVPTKYPHIIRFAKNFMVIEGRITKSYLKNGILYDTVILGSLPWVGNQH